MKNFKSKKGITLVALIITIIVLLVLAGIAISQLTGSGLFENSKVAKEKYSNAQEREETQIAKYSNDIESYVSGNRDYEAEINKLKAKIVELESNNKYSTSEKVVGTWIDGRPIYRYCYIFTKTVTDDIEVKFEDMGLDDYIFFDKILKSELHVISSNNNFCANEFYMNSGDFYGHYINSGMEKVTFRSGENWPKLPSEFMFIIEYTKTTDIAPAT